MDANNGHGFRSDGVAIKKEPGVKSEFEPSLASLPMAPPSIPKREFADEKKSTSGNAPEHRGKGRRFRRGHGGSSLVHLVDGYHIRAHYGQGKVDFTITKNTSKTRDLNWREIERVIFEKLHRVGFRVEPTERPGTVLQAFSGFKSGSILRFSVTTRAIPARVPVPPTSGVGTNLAVHAGGIGGDLKDDEAKTTLDVKVDKLRQLEPEYRQAYLPAYLPEISSHRIDDDWGNRYLNVNFQVHRH